MNDWKEMIPKDCKFNKMTPIMDKLQAIAEETKKLPPISKSPISINGVKYLSCQEAEFLLGISDRDIDERIKSKAFAYVGYVYLEDAE